MQKEQKETLNRSNLVENPLARRPVDALSLALCLSGHTPTTAKPPQNLALNPAQALLDHAETAQIHIAALRSMLQLSVDQQADLGKQVAAAKALGASQATIAGLQSRSQTVADQTEATFLTLDLASTAFANALAAVNGMLKSRDSDKPQNMQ